jgi:hypothetical protein
VRSLIVVLAIALAAVAVLAAVVVLATGRGGELAETHPDHPPLALPGTHLMTGTDAALLRLPTGLWGYHPRITDEALEQLALTLTERDTRIAILEEQIARLRARPAGDLKDGLGGAGLESAGLEGAPGASRWDPGPEPQAPPASPPDVLSGSARELMPAFDPYDERVRRQPGPYDRSERRHEPGWDR